MKKLTLDETWDKCLAMWKWIDANCEDACGFREITTLKERWLMMRGYVRPLVHDCFFLRLRQ